MAENPYLSNEEWIALMVEQYGRKTINEVRWEHGRDPVEGGEIAYIDWLKEMAGVPLRPSLRLVPSVPHD